MIHLKLIDNPFSEDMMYFLSSFREEKSFYDCINRRFLNEDAFKHLEHTFLMFSLTGDSDEWIGYILFSNEDRINSYYQEAYHQTRILLEKYKNKYLNLNNKRELERLTNLILNSNNINDIRLILEKLKSPLTELDQAIINSMLIDYNNKMDQFLNQLPEYFYLDVVIALPKDEEINLKYENKNTDINYLVESKYYGFIGESLSLANELIKDNFMDIPILLRNNDNFIEVNKVYKKK